MVILIFLHMGRTFFFGAYKYPRELNWVIGVVLLILTMAMALHRLPAAVRPALLLGHDRRHQHHRHRPDRRPLPERLPARRARVRGDHALALLRDPHAAGARGDHRPDRRPPLPRRQARHDRAAVAAGRASRRSPRRSPSSRPASTATERRRRMKPPRRRHTSAEYEVLKKKGKPFFPYAVHEGLGDGADRRRS